jgi:hypothetical protein
VFGSGRRPAKTRSELFRDELGETYDHLKQAASHGADTVSTAMRPRMSAAKKMAVGTAAGAMARMAAAKRHRAEHGGEAARKGMPMMRMPMMRRKKREAARHQRGYRLASLLAIGAAVGAVGALVGRRRRQTSWEVYDTSTRPPQKPVEMSGASSGPPSESQSRQPMPGKGTRDVGPLAEQARSALSGAAGSEAPEAEAIAPITEPSSNRRR